MQVDGAKDTAAILVTRAGEWSAERLRIAAQEAGADLVERISEQAERGRRAAMRTAWIAFSVTALVITGAAEFWFGSFITR